MYVLVEYIMLYNKKTHHTLWPMTSVSWQRVLTLTSLCRGIALICHKISNSISFPFCPRVFACWTIVLGKAIYELFQF